MSKFNPSTNWAIKDLKRKLKVEKEMKKSGMMDAKGRMNPYVLRTLAQNCAGTVDNKKMAIFAGIILTIAALGGLAYYEMHQDHSTHSTPGVNGDIDVQVHQTDLEKIVTVSGNATAGKGLSGIEIEVQKSSSQVFDGTQSISGKKGMYTKDFDASTKEPGTYKAIVKIKDMAGKVKELSKEFVLGDLTSVVTSATVDTSAQKIMVAYQDKDNDVVAASVAIVKPGTNQAINGSIYDVFLEPKKDGNFTISFKENSLPDGKYDLLVSLKDDSNKNSPDKRVPFELSTAPVNQPPAVTSWDIQSNSKQPQLYVNASDDVQVKEVTVELYDKVTDVLAFTKTYTPNAKTVAINEKLDLGSVAKGNYTVKVKAKDEQGKVSTILEKLIEVPNSAPTIDVPYTHWDQTNQKWHIGANASDIDGNLKYIHINVKLAQGNVSVDNSTAPVSGYKNSAETVGRFWAGTTYCVDTWAEDENGLMSEVKSTKFTA